MCGALKRRLVRRRGLGAPSNYHSLLVHFLRHRLPTVWRTNCPPHLWRRLSCGAALLGVYQTALSLLLPHKNTIAPGQTQQKTIATRARLNLPLPDPYTPRNATSHSSSSSLFSRGRIGAWPAGQSPEFAAAATSIEIQERMVAPVVIASAGLGMLAGVAMANRSLGDGLPAASRWDARPRCSTCGGSGRVECLCNRWSDGDAGCRSCAGSGRMPCRSCGGSGTGRPLPARLIVQNQQKPPPYN